MRDTNQCLFRQTHNESEYNNICEMSNKVGNETVEEIKRAMCIHIE